MNINIYLENELAEEINCLVKSTGKSRNAIVREALKEWVAHHTSRTWSKAILNFKGCPDIPPFEATRDELILPKEDPFA